MSDFHQSGTITTLHALYDAYDPGAYLVDLERRLEEHAQRRRICLLLPSLFAELQNTQVMNRIMDEIQPVRYLHKIVIALGGTTDKQEFQQAKDYFGQLRTETRDVKVVWIEGPRIQQILQNIRDRAITTGIQGKGQSVWIALGYLFATNDTDVIGLHDCDISTYSRILLGRLLEPTANPNNDFQFCKGYYARISPTEQMMKGRVTRVFVFPFVDAMANLMNEHGLGELESFFRYHASFKYPLAGEFSFTTHLARSINVAYDWGLEVATLSQVYDQVIQRKIAQIDLLPNYEHKHQGLSPENANTGLHRMVIDIAKFYLTFMRSHGVALNDSFVDMMLHTYYQNALKFIRKYSYDAKTNALTYNLYEEEEMARNFRGMLWSAWEQSRGPNEAKLIPSWNRVRYSFLDIYPQLLEAVEADNAG
jgi:glucosyl-3-phosphoglycerate synthase